MGKTRRGNVIWLKINITLNLKCENSGLNSDINLHGVDYEIVIAFTNYYPT